MSVHGRQENKVNNEDFRSVSDIKIHIFEITWNKNKDAKWMSVSKLFIEAEIKVVEESPQYDHILRMEVPGIWSQSLIIQQQIYFMEGKGEDRARENDK